MRRVIEAGFAAGLALVCLAPAHAAPTPVVQKPYDSTPDGDKMFSLTISPLHLLMPAVELTAELDVAPKVGAALIGGIGSIGYEVERNGATEKDSALVFELGAQARWYAIGNFTHGMDLALEVAYVGVDAKRGAQTDFDTVFASGIAVSPLIGYKIATAVGFTFDVQVGAQLVQIDTTSASGESSSEMAILPNANLNIGWSW